MRVSWVSVFLDLLPAEYDAGAAFWSAVTGWTLSPPRGRQEEFATLLPSSGDPVLKVQRVSDGGGVHVDLHAGSERLCQASPGGFPFCHVGFGPVGESFARPPVADWGTHTSVVDQVCLDIPAVAFEEECAFWAGLVDEGSGWSWADTHDPDYRRLQPPTGQPWRLLLQRRLEGAGPVTAHLDLATTSRSQETSRHVALGATVVRVFDEWTVLSDPTGRAYCITDRVPR